MFKLDAPTLATIGGLISTWLGMILGYLAHKNVLASRVAAAAAAAPTSTAAAPSSPSSPSSPLAAAMAPNGPGYQP